MREIRLFGSEGGEEFKPLSLPLSTTPVDEHAGSVVAAAGGRGKSERKEEWAIVCPLNRSCLGSSFSPAKWRLR